jgi:hypothetical protein
MPGRCTDAMAGVCLYEREARAGWSWGWRWCSKAGGGVSVPDELQPGGVFGHDCAVATCARGGAATCHAAHTTDDVRALARYSPSLIRRHTPLSTCAH